MNNILMTMMVLALHEQQKADWEDEQQAVKLRCEMCFDSKWKSACPECDGTGYYTPDAPVSRS